MQQVPSQPMKLGFPPPLFRLADVVECVSDSLSPSSRRPDSAAGLREEGAIVGQAQSGRRLQRVDAATNPGDGAVARALRGAAPAAQHFRPGEIVGESVLGRVRDRGVGQPIDLRDVSQKLAEHRGVRQGDRPRKRVTDVEQPASIVSSARARARSG